MRRVSLSPRPVATFRFNGVLRWSESQTACALMLSLAALLLPVSAARGAVVQLRVGGGSPPEVVDLQITGLPGESNLVTIARGSDGTLTVRDDGAPVLPGENCTGGGSEARCSVARQEPPLQLEIATSDGDDRIAIEGPLSYRYSFLSGGSGADVIIGGSADDNIYGNAGDDRLVGLAGDDELMGDAGADSLHGGPGVDTAKYGDHHDPVSVTLDDRPDDGGAGEGDNAGLDIENVTGGSGPNRLIGSDAANTLEGGEDVNELSGGGGADQLIARSSRGGRLTGGPGRDTLTPGADSSIDVRDGEVDQVQCDNGLARRPRADAVDDLRRCVPQADIRGVTARVIGAGRVQLRVRCDAIAQRCRVRVELRRRGRKLARATLAIRAGRDQVVIRLNRYGLQLLARQRTLEVTRRLQVFRTAPPRSSGIPIEAPLTLRRR